MGKGSKVSTTTRQRILALSGNVCAYAGCDRPICDPKHGVFVGDVAHIAGSKAGAARYDPPLSEEEAHGYENLIALCKEHHAIVDGREAWYPKVVLLNWKSEHDEAQASRADRSWIRPPKVAILIHDGTQTPVSWWVDRFGKDRIYSDEQLEVIGVLFRLRMFTGTIGTVFETLGNLGSTDVDTLITAVVGKVRVSR